MRKPLTLQEINTILINTEMALTFLNKLLDYYIHENSVTGYEISVLLEPHVVAVREASSALNNLLDQQHIRS